MISLALRNTFIAIAVSLSPIEFVPTRVAARASTPSASPTEISQDVLHSVPLAALGAGDHVVVFSRVMLTQGESYGVNALPGPIVAYLANGDLSVHATGAANLIRAGSDESVALTGSATNAAADDLLLLSAGASLEVKNAGAHPSSLFVAAIMVSPERESTPTSEQVGFSDPVNLQSGPTNLTISRLTLQPGATTSNHRAAGPELIEVQTGSTAIALNPGRFRILREDGGMELVNAGIYDPAAQPTLDPNDSEQREEIGARAERTGVPLVGSTIGLDAGDAGVLESNGVRTIRGGGAETAIVLVIALSPAGPELATPSR